MQMPDSSSLDPNYRILGRELAMTHASRGYSSDPHTVCTRSSQPCTTSTLLVSPAASYQSLDGELTTN